MKPTPLLTLLALAALAGCSSAPKSSQPAAPAPASGKMAAVQNPEASADPAPMPADGAESAAAETPAPTDASAAAATPSDPHAEPVLPIFKLTPETEAVVFRLTHAVGGNTSHEMADATGFPSALASLQTGAPAPKLEKLGNINLPPPKGLTADGNSTELIERDWTGLVLVPVETALSKAYTSEVRLLKVEAHPLHDGRLRIWTRVRNVSDRTLPAEIACSFRMRGETTPNSPYFYELRVPPGAFRDVFFVSPDGELSAYTVLVRSAEMWKEK